MKTAKDVHEWIGETVNLRFTNQDELIEGFLSNWEKEIRKNQVNKCAEAIRNIERYSIDRLECEKAIQGTIKQ
ncbi:hypothetical protein KAR91_43555 [Candidatus Pacearchaeota archaeon]|nr:hypothetical protein [Candidatus Pacearchaeota archaeon]